MKKILVVVAIVICFSLIVGCTQQNMAKNFGGKATIDLPPGQKLVVATWKDDDLWYLMRPMRVGEVPEIYTFKESSSFGVMEGEVIFKEH